MHVNIYEELQDENEHRKQVLIVMYMEQALMYTDEKLKAEKLYQQKSYPHILYEKTTQN